MGDSMIKKIFYVFLTILPIIDLITSLIARNVSLPLSLGTFIKGVFLTMLLYYMIFKTKSSHKKKVMVALSFILLYELIYFICKVSILDIRTLILEIIGQFKYLFFPITLLGLVCFFDEYGFDKEKISKILCINFCIYILLLILPTITNTAFKSYGNYVDQSGYVGWFYAANEISMILLMLLPFVYMLEEKVNTFMFLIISLTSLYVLSTVGTKVLIFGPIIISAFMLIISLIRENDKLNVKRILVRSVILVFSIFFTTNDVATHNLAFMKENIESEDERYVLTEEQLEKVNQKYGDNLFYRGFQYVGKRILSDRDVYLRYALYYYDEYDTPNKLLTGVGVAREGEYNLLVENDPIDLQLYYGFMALLISFAPFFVVIYRFIKVKKNKFMVMVTSMICLTYAISCISGHVLMAPAVSLYLVMYFMFFLSETNIFRNIED